MTAGDEPDVIGREDRDESFEDFVSGSSARLFTMALLLTGRHRAEAEDLLQGVLERAYRRWRRINQGGDPEPYVRRMLVNASTDRWRRLRRRPEEPLRAARAEPAAGDGAAEVADRDLLLRALAVLPARQRAVLVLRYYSDLSEAQTAATLGCSVGSVKSQSSRALARLRALAGMAPEGDPGRRGDEVRHG
jgi:RNA polymerase sigma-70 factor (sigma-E family)